MPTEALADLANTQEAETALDALLDDEANDETSAPVETEKAQDQQDMAEDKAEETAADPQAGDSEDAPEQPDTVDAQEEQGDSDPQDATLAPPARWDADQLEVWATLSPAAQKVVLAREKTAQGEITRRQQENARLQLELQDERSKPDTELEQLIIQGKQRFGSKYSDLTDTALLGAVNSGQITPEQAKLIAQERDAEALALQKLERAQETRQAQQLQDHIERRKLELKRDMPELTTSAEAQSLVLRYLEAQGYTEEQANWATSSDLITVYKAAQFDALQNVTKTAKPAATKTGKKVSARPVQSGSNKAQRRADLMRKGDRASMEALLDMELDED